MKACKWLFFFVFVSVLMLAAVPVDSGYASENISAGISVSSWNKEIDWTLVSKQVDFALLRIGSQSTSDGYYEANAAGCDDNGLPYGVYYVCAATNVAEAKAEADFVIKALDGRRLRLPVFLDVEYKLLKNLSSEQVQAVVLAFCQTISEAGYQPGIYSYADVLEEYFSSDAFTQLSKWVNQVDVDQCTYSGEFVLWSYTWAGRIEGVAGDVECNYYYGDLSESACEHESVTYSFANNTHTFTCDVCGEVAFTKDGSDGKQFKIASAQPELASNIVMYLGAQLPAGFSDPRIEVEFNGETSYLYESTINSLGRYEFAFDRINPKIMSDTFVATLYATVDGYEVSAKLEYSMLKYLNSQLKKSSLSAANRTVMSDLIAYGDANQIYANYKADALISTLLAETATLTPSTFTALDASYNVQKVITGENRDLIDFKTVTLVLDSKVVVSVKVYCPNAEGYSVNVNLAGVDYTYPVSELEPIEGEDGYYYLNFEEIRASQFDEVVTVSFLNAEGTQISRTLEYSVYTYIQKNQNSTDTKLVDLLKAIYNYGEAAKKI